MNLVSLCNVLFTNITYESFLFERMHILIARERKGTCCVRHKTSPNNHSLSKRDNFKSKQRVLVKVPHKKKEMWSITINTIISKIYSMC